MATQEQNIARFQEIANRGIEGRLDPEMRARFDEAARRGIINLPQQAAAPQVQQEFPGQQILSPAARQLDPQQQIEMVRGLQVQRESVGAPVEGLGPTSQAKRSEEFEQLRQRNPDLAAIIEELNPVQAARIGFATGLRTVGRGAGKVVGADLFPDVRDPAIQELGKVSRAASFAELAGEVAPFAAVSPFAALPRTLLGRGAAGGALGGTEGAAISAGKDRPAEEIALATGLSVFLGGGSEVLLPVIRRTMRKRASELGITTDRVLTPDGTLTKEVKDKLAEKGVDEKRFMTRAIRDADIPKDQQKSMIAALDEAKLPATGLPATRGEALESEGAKEAFAQLKSEQQILQSSSETGDQFRAFKLRQSQEAERFLADVSPGDASVLGPAIRDAIELRESSAKFARSQAYRQLGEVTKDLDVELSVRAVGEAMPDARRMRVFSNTSPGESKAVQEILTEFGVVAPGAGFKGTVTPVSVSNYEDLRQILGDIEKGDITGRTSSIITPIRQALDDEFELASKALEATGEASVAQAAKAARQSNVALKTEFDQKGMVDQLIAPKAIGSRIPKIEDSKIYTTLVAKSTPVEQFDNVVKSLDRAASRGKLAKDQLKSRMVLDLIDSGFQAKTRKIQGQEVFGAAAFGKRFEEMKPKLEKIFTKDEMGRLNAFASDARNLVPPQGTSPLGSAGFLIDALDKMGVWTLADKVAPGVGGVVAQQLKRLGRDFKAEKTAVEAMKAPKIKEVAELIQSDYPALSAALLPAIAISGDDE